jgi:urease subunit gamma
MRVVVVVRLRDRHVRMRAGPNKIDETRTAAAHRNHADADPDDAVRCTRPGASHSRWIDRPRSALRNRAGCDNVALPAASFRSRRPRVQLTPREFDKLLIYMMAEVARKRMEQGIKLNYPEAVSIISAKALDGARSGLTIEEVMSAARSVLTKADVMDGVADLVDMVQVEAVFTDGSRLVTVHAPIQ